ncbi:MAG: hypothetical protein ACPG5U_02950 [Planktomarina sp.]
MQSENKQKKDRTSQLLVHRIFRTITLIIIFLGITVYGGLNAEAALGTGGLRYFLIASVCFFVVWNIIRVVFVFDPFLFAKSTSQITDADKTQTSESEFKQALIAKLDDQNISHNLTENNNAQMPEFLHRAISDVSEHQAAKFRKEKQRYVSEISELKSEVTNRDREYQAELNRLRMVTSDNKRELRDLEASKIAAVKTVNKYDLLAEVIARADILTSSDPWDQKDAKQMIDILLENSPDLKDKIKALAHISVEEKRISQYESIINLYNKKIANIRAQDMDEEDQEEAIIAMKRLRDREIDTLEQS